MKIESDFAILDVRKGRKKLEARFHDKPCLGPFPESLRIPIVIHGYISGVWGNDDGVSQEFEVTVESVEVS